MGNTSSEGSSFTTGTDDSASESMHRTPVRTPVRTPTTQPPRGSLSGATTPTVPQEPPEMPEADLSHLTEEERAHIMSVLNRARNLQDREEQRVR